MSKKLIAPIKNIWVLIFFIIVCNFGQGETAHSDATALAMQGNLLTAGGAQQLENTIKKDPEDLTARTKLLGYYQLKAFESEEARKSREGHILWIIEHHPESEIAGLPFAGLDPIIDIKVYSKGKELWLKQVENHNKNSIILGNAANYFLIHEQDLAEKFLKEAQSLEPNNPKWSQQLGLLYSLEGNHPKLAVNPEDSYKKSLNQLETSFQNTKSPNEKFYLLDALAKTAFEAGDVKKANNYAHQLLDRATMYQSDWNYGNAINHGNIVLGRIAIKENNIDKAKEYLLKAGNTPGSPQLNSFGPNMSLAKDLFEKGEKKTVIEYLNLCKKFWKEEQLNEWIKEIQSGQTPNFGGNLDY